MNFKIIDLKNVLVLYWHTGERFADYSKWETDRCGNSCACELTDKRYAIFAENMLETAQGVVDLQTQKAS